MCEQIFFSFTAMSPVGELASYRDTPIFGWVSDSPSLSNKDTYTSLVRVLQPINAIGTLLETKWRPIRDSFQAHKAKRPIVPL